MKVFWFFFSKKNVLPCLKKTLASPRKVRYIPFMSIPPPTPLPQALQALVGELRAESALRAAEAGLVAALQALILTLLVRLLSRLEAMVTLWQAGLLPPPTPRAIRPRAPRPECIGAPSRRTRRPRAPNPARKPVEAPHARPTHVPRHPAWPRQAPPAWPIPTPESARPQAPFVQNPSRAAHLRTC
jgi:hypothetical protein